MAKADRVSLLTLPLKERPLDFRDFSYSLIKTKRDIGITDVHVVLTFSFGRKNPFEIHGSEWQSFEETDIPLCEAKSFIDAAQASWGDLGRYEDRKVFVKERLECKWKEIKGTDLTGKDLIFEDEGKLSISPV